MVARVERVDEKFEIFLRQNEAQFIVLIEAGPANERISLCAGPLPGDFVQIRPGNQPGKEVM